jgi:hypothetical protein
LGEGTFIENVVPEHIAGTASTVGAAGADTTDTVMGVRDMELQELNIAPTKYVTSPVGAVVKVMSIAEPVPTAEPTFVPPDNAVYTMYVTPDCEVDKCITGLPPLQTSSADKAVATGFSGICSVTTKAALGLDGHSDDGVTTTV